VRGPRLAGENNLITYQRRIAQALRRLLDEAARPALKSAELCNWLERHITLKRDVFAKGHKMMLVIGVGNHTFLIDHLHRVGIGLAGGIEIQDAADDIG